MSTKIPLQQTLHLLDTRDRLREQAAEAPMRELLTRHLMDISESQGSTLTQAEAEAVVSTAMAIPEAAPDPSAQGWDRPGSQDAWRVAQDEAKARVDLSQSEYNSISRRNTLQFWWLFALLLTMAGAAMASAICLGGLAGMILGATAVLFLGVMPAAPLLIFELAGLDARLHAARDRYHQDHNVRFDLDEAPEPTLETLAAWAQVPGLSPMLHSIVASEVPFLRLDLEHIQARVAQHEKEQEAKAEEDRKRRLRQDSLDLLRHQMGVDPKH